MIVRAQCYRSMLRMYCSQLQFKETKLFVFVVATVVACYTAVAVYLKTFTIKKLVGLPLQPVYGNVTFVL